MPEKPDKKKDSPSSSPSSNKSTTSEDASTTTTAESTKSDSPVTIEVVKTDDAAETAIEFLEGDESASAIDIGKDIVKAEDTAAADADSAPDASSDASAASLDVLEGGDESSSTIGSTTSKSKKKDKKDKDKDKDKGKDKDKEKDEEKAKKKKDKKEKKKKKKHKKDDDECSVGSGSSYYYNYDSDSSMGSSGSDLSHLICGNVAKKKNRKVIAKEASRSSLLDSASIPNGSIRRQSLLSDDEDDDSIEEDKLSHFEMDLTFLKSASFSASGSGLNAALNRSSELDTASLDNGTPAAAAPPTAMLKKNKMVRRVKSSGMYTEGSGREKPPLLKALEKLKETNPSLGRIREKKEKERQKKKKSTTDDDDSDDDNEDGAKDREKDKGKKSRRRRSKSKSPSEDTDSDDDSEEEHKAKDRVRKGRRRSGKSKSPSEDTDSDDDSDEGQKAKDRVRKTRRRKERSASFDNYDDEQDNEKDVKFDWTKRKALSSRDLNGSSLSMLSDSEEEEEVVLFDWSSVKAGNGEDKDEKRRRKNRSNSVTSGSDDDDGSSNDGQSKRKSTNKKANSDDNSDDDFARPRLRRSKSSGDSATGALMTMKRKTNSKKEEDASTSSPKRKSKKDKVKDIQLLEILDLMDDSESNPKVRKGRKLNKEELDGKKAPAIRDASVESKRAPRDEAPKSAKDYSPETKKSTKDEAATINVSTEENETKKKKAKKDKTAALEADDPDLQDHKSTDRSSPTGASAEENETKKKKAKKDKTAGVEAVALDLIEQKSADSGDLRRRGSDEAAKHDWEAGASSALEDSERVENQATIEDDAEFLKTAKKKSKDKKEKKKEKDGTKVRKTSLESQDQVIKEGATVSAEQPKDDEYYNWSPRKLPTKSPRKSSSKLKKTMISNDGTQLPDMLPLARATSSPIPLPSLDRPQSSPTPQPMSRASSATAGTQDTWEAIPPDIDDSERRDSTSSPPIKSPKKKTQSIAKLDLGVKQTALLDKKSEEEEKEALVTYASSILKMFTDNPTDFTDAAVVALLQEFPQSASIKFTLHSSCFRAGKGKSKHYLLSLLCALGASRETIILCLNLNPEAIHKFDEWIGTPLHYAISFGITASFSREMWTDSIFEAVEYLIEKEPRLLTSQHNEKNESVLHQAILCLCSLAGPVSDGSSVERSPNDVEQLAALADVVITLLLENEPSLASMPNTDNQLPLHLAAMYGVPPGILRRIHKENEEACSVVCSAKGFSPLHYAAEAFGEGAVKIASGLKRRKDGDGIDLNKLSARLAGHAENIKNLVAAYPAAAQIEDLEGNLPLHVLMHACYKHSNPTDDPLFPQTPAVFVMVATTISEAYPDADHIPDSYGDTPYLMAKKRKEGGDHVMLDSFVEPDEEE